MESKGFWVGKYPKINVLVLVCFMLAGLGLVYFKTDILSDAVSRTAGLSGLVSVRGAVSLEQLDFSDQEVKAINTAVNAQRATFKKVVMHVDARDSVDVIEEDTILVFAVALETKGDLEIKSWTRKIPRRVLVAQLVDYLRKAGREYEEFKKFPDVKKNFKTLYI